MKNTVRKWLPGLLVTAAAAAVAGADTEVRDVADFTGVTFALPGHLTLRQGEAFEVVVEAIPEDLERIETQVRGDTLRIRWKEGLFGILGGDPQGDDLRVRVTMPALDTLELAGSGTVEGGTWIAESFTLEVTGSGDARFDELSTEVLVLELAGSGSAEVAAVDAAEARIDVSGSGDVTLAGAADVQQIKVMGSGDVDASELEGARVTTEIMGSGDVGVWATESLSARILGSGDVRYRGSPRVDRQEHGSGRVGPW